MKIVRIYTGADNKSHFEELEPGVATQRKLGSYSKEYPVQGMFFRTFTKGALFDWHTAPRTQYIIYLEGQVEVEASNGEVRVFNPGDILLADDLTGKGHISRTLTPGRSIIVTAEKAKEYYEEQQLSSIQAKL